ncbi:MAG: hypothetical protein IIA41_04640 [SAR324 cluster bacterium]|nr:hypothetical protein [SAR324 cluster bacterium]
MDAESMAHRKLHGESPRKLHRESEWEPRREALDERVRKSAAEAGLEGERVEAALGARDYFALLELLIPRRDRLPAEVVAELRGALEALLKFKVYAHPAQLGVQVPIVFGTGGHRGEIGLGLTLAHVHAIVTALVEQIEAMAPEERRVHCGAPDLDEVRERGFTIGHDNRLFNPEFSCYAAHLLREAGFHVRYAGIVSTPELSRVVVHLGWAGAINFTPSHNPFRYGGIKTNPADGGLAGPELTEPLAVLANRNLERLAEESWPDFDTLEALIARERERVERVDVHTPYLECLDAHPVLRLGELCATLKELGQAGRLRWVVDPVWGASVPVYRRILERVGEEALTLLHTEDDPYFGGQTTEPNEQTLGDALAVLRSSRCAYKVAIRNDPDSDRGLVGDEGGAIKMNRFAALVLRYLMDIGESGQVVTTLPTSHLGPDYARAHGSQVVLTPTGFKNFRPYLKDGKTLLAYEESDGMTIRGHTLDKDGLLVGLLAVRIVLHYGRPLSELMGELESQLGRYYYRQETFLVELSAAEAHQRLKKLAAIRPGECFQAGGVAHPITAVDARDGYKFILDDGAWVMMRPSGTEPKVRVYAESRHSDEATRILCEAAQSMALEAVRRP